MNESRNKILVYIGSFLFFIAGVGAAVLLVYNFSSQKSAKIEESNKDTLFVKLVDHPYPSAITIADKKEEVFKDMTKENTRSDTIARTRDSIFNLPPQVGRTLPKNNPLPIENFQSKKNASAMSLTYAIKKAFSPNVMTGIFIAILIFSLAFFSKKDRHLHAKQKDKDPPDLQVLFSNFKEEIGLLRNPRKILRFMNLVKYHYYFLNKNNITGDDNLRKMMWLLLGIQSNPSLVSTEGIEGEQLSDSRWFYDKIQKEPWFNASEIKQADNDLIMIILKLNIDMGS